MAANQYSIAAIGQVAETTAAMPVHGQIHALLKNSKYLKYCVPNEYICAEIGRYLCLPIPPSGLCYQKGHDPEHWFASWNFNFTASSLPPIDVDQCYQELPSESTGLILFDILIANNDRHRKNVSLDLSYSPARMSVFDHSHALFGAVDGRGKDRLDGNRDSFVITDHCLLKSVSSDRFFNEWISRIAGLLDYLIEHACEATVPLGMITTAEARVAKEFLKYRKEQIKSIVTKNKREFTGIKTWSLL